MRTSSKHLIKSIRNNLVENMVTLETQSADRISLIIIMKHVVEGCFCYKAYARGSSHTSLMKRHKHSCIILACFPFLTSTTNIFYGLLMIRGLENLFVVKFSCAFVIIHHDTFLDVYRFKRKIHWFQLSPELLLCCDYTGLPCDHYRSTKSTECATR